MLINATITKNKFPPRLKAAAQVLPLYKKNDPLNKENFRPVSVLCIISKTYERVMHNQLSDHFEISFDPYLAAFRKGFGCMTTLLRLLEDWKKALHGFMVNSYLCQLVPSQLVLFLWSTRT